MDSCPILYCVHYKICTFQQSLPLLCPNSSVSRGKNSNRFFPWFTVVYYLLQLSNQLSFTEKPATIKYIQDVKLFRGYWCKNSYLFFSSGILNYRHLMHNQESNLVTCEEKIARLPHWPSQVAFLVPMYFQINQFLIF